MKNKDHIQTQTMLRCSLDIIQHKKKHIKVTYVFPGGLYTPYYIKRSLIYTIYIGL